MAKCGACEGYGYWDVYGFDWVPYGDTEVQMPTGERVPCDECFGLGKCPKCGHEIDEIGDEIVSCSACGWWLDWDKAPDHERVAEDDRW